MQFVAYPDLGTIPNVVVDGAAAPSTRFVLSHWPGSATPDELRRDLSAEIALAALDRPDLFEGIDVVSNNHFDQDGLMSAHVLLQPDAARIDAPRVVDVARAGDFGSFVDRDSLRASFAIAAMSEAESSPFAAELFAGDYAQRAGRLYEATLPLVPELLHHVDRWQPLWEHEDAHVAETEAAINSRVVVIEEDPSIDLAVVTVPESWGERMVHRFTEQGTGAAHPSAIANATDAFRVLTVQGASVRLECRYETWVQFVSRPVLARPDLRVIAEELSALDSVAWEADAPSDLTPTLRATGPSSLPPERTVGIIRTWLQTAPGAWDPNPRSEP